MTAVDFVHRAAQARSPTDPPRRLDHADRRVRDHIPDLRAGFLARRPCPSQTIRWRAYPTGSVCSGTRACSPIEVGWGRWSCPWRSPRSFPRSAWSVALLVGRRLPRMRRGAGLLLGGFMLPLVVPGIVVGINVFIFYKMLFGLKMGAVVADPLAFHLGIPVRADGHAGGSAAVSMRGCSRQRRTSARRRGGGSGISSAPF